MKNKVYILSLVLSTLILSSCSITKTATLINLENGERIIATFKDSNATGGSCEATMLNGEKLIGRYVGIRGTDAVSFGMTSGNISANTDYSYNSQNVLNSKTSGNYSETGATRTVGGQGKAYALLYSTNPNSKLTLEIIAIYNVLGGGGFGDARTNDGRKYKIIF